MIKSSTKFLQNFKRNAGGDECIEKDVLAPLESNVQNDC